MSVLDIDLLRVGHGLCRPNGFITQSKFIGLANAYNKLQPIHLIMYSKLIKQNG